MRPFAPRLVRFHGVHAVAACNADSRHARGGLDVASSWRVKTYSISHDGAPIQWAKFVDGVKLALRSLPVESVAVGRPGVAFLIAHQGLTADYAVLCWWDQENELPVRVCVRAPGQSSWRAAKDSESVCVWDLEILWFEREAYVRTVLAPQPSPLPAKRPGARVLGAPELYESPRSEVASAGGAPSASRASSASGASSVGGTPSTRGTSSTREASSETGVNAPSGTVSDADPAAQYLARHLGTPAEPPPSAAFDVAGSTRDVSLSLAAGRVRSWRWSDAESLALHANNKKVWQNLRDAFPHPYSLADAHAFLSRAIGATPSTVFAIEVDERAVGGIGFVLHTDVERTGAEIGYWLGEPYWGRGIVTDAVRAVTAYAIETHGLTRVYALPFARNAPSHRVLEKAGFVLEGTMRKSAIKDGRIDDQRLYAYVV